MSSVPSLGAGTLGQNGILLFISVLLILFLLALKAFDSQYQTTFDLFAFLTPLFQPSSNSMYFANDNKHCHLKIVNHLSHITKV